MARVITLAVKVEDDEVPVADIVQTVERSLRTPSRLTLAGAVDVTLVAVDSA